MEINITDYENGLGVVHIVGELNANTAQEVTNFFSQTVGSSYTNIIVDLSGLAYSSSAGVRALLGAARSTRQNGGDLRIAAVPQSVYRIFELSQFDKIVKVFDTIDDAVASYSE